MNNVLGGAGVGAVRVVGSEWWRLRGKEGEAAGRVWAAGVSTRCVQGSPLFRNVQMIHKLKLHNHLPFILC